MQPCFDSFLYTILSFRTSAGLLELSHPCCQYNSYTKLLTFYLLRSNPRRLLADLATAASFEIILNIPRAQPTCTPVVPFGTRGQLLSSSRSNSFSGAQQSLYRGTHRDGHTATERCLCLPLLLYIQLKHNTHPV